MMMSTAIIKRPSCVVKWEVRRPNAPNVKSSESRNIEPMTWQSIDQVAVCGERHILARNVLPKCGEIIGERRFVDPALSL